MEGVGKVSIDFEYDLDEIVQMNGGPITLRSALKRMPDQISALAVLYRDMGKAPAFFDAAQIDLLRARHASDAG
jgi:hypothetical protein